jgi:hypothetical protein
MLHYGLCCIVVKARESHFGTQTRTIVNTADYRIGMLHNFEIVDLSYFLSVRDFVGRFNGAVCCHTVVLQKGKKTWAR